MVGELLGHELLCMPPKAKPLLWGAGAGLAVPLQTITIAPLRLLCEAMATIGVGWCLLQTSVRLSRKGLVTTKNAAEAPMCI